MKEDYDGAEPTASSISVMNLLVLSHLVEDDKASQTWTDRIERTLRLFAARLDQVGRGVPMMAAALSTYLAGFQQVVVVGNQGRDRLDHSLARQFAPFAVTLSVSDDRRESLARALPFTAAMKPVGGRAAAYVCRAFACHAPVTDPEQREI